MIEDVETSSHPGASRVLLVDDEPDQVALLRAMFTPLGMDVSTAESAEQALASYRRRAVDIVVTDLNLPGASGIDLIRDLRQGDTPPAVILITGEGSVSSAVEALKLGASDYLQKPVDPARLVTLVKELLRSDDVREAGENEHLPLQPLVFEGMVGGSSRMREVFSRIERVAPTGAPVLIVGESGTGKELVARALHNRSRRAQGPFVPIHTGAIPRELVASELFGHEKGAFTGALSASEGKFEAAAGGTVFLDEVGTMDLSTQISLLRVLETYRFTRVGASKERDADVRIIAATNRDLLDLVEANQFREDLYYRLNVFTIALPPLRDRTEDIVPIAERFLRFFAKRYATPARCLSDMATDRLLAHKWPGNVRELRNVMEQTAVFAQREVVHADEVQFVSTRLPGHRGPRPITQTNGKTGASRSADDSASRDAVPLTDMPPPSGPEPDTQRSGHSDGTARAPSASQSQPMEVGHGASAPAAAAGAAAPVGAASAAVGGEGGVESGSNAELPRPGPGLDPAAGGALPTVLAADPSSAALAPAVAAPSAASAPPTRSGPESSSTCPPAPGVAPTRTTAAPADDHPLIVRIPVGTPLAEAERMLIIRTLEVADGNKQRAARILGISRRGLYTKLAAYGEHIPAEDQSENGTQADTTPNEA